jgi:multiple sugar transport system substrate-binding protein
MEGVGVNRCGKECKMKKLLLLVCVAAMLLAACGGATEEPSPVPVPATPNAGEPGESEGEKVTIRFAIYDWEQASYGDLIDAFEDENPGIEVQMVSINEVLEMGSLTDFEWPDDAERRLASAADVVGLEASSAGVQQGLVRDLAPFIEADPGFQPDDFYPNTLESYRWDGGTWSLPTSLSFQLILFDKDAFDEAGEAYPELGWGWDDFLAKARALTRRDGDEVARWGFVAPFSNHRLLVESMVGPLIDDSTEPPLPRYDQAEVIDAVRWYTDLYLKEQVMPFFEPGDEITLLPEEEVLIDEGKAAMWPESDLVWWWRNQQGNVGAVPFPVDIPGALATPAWTSGLTMSAGTAQADAAWRFMDFVTRQPSAGLGLGVQSLPARRSVVESTGFWDGVDEELAATLQYAIEHSQGRPQALTGYGAFGDALQAIFKGERSVEDALLEAQTHADADIQEALAEKAAATPAPTVVVAPPEGGTPVAEGTVTITFLPGLGALDMGPYRDLAERFHEVHPEIVVEVEMPDFFGGSVPGLPGMAEVADCFIWYPSFQEVKNRDAVLSLEPFLDADPSFDIDDFYPQTLGDFTWQGQLLGMPADVTPYIIEYNKDLFDAAGVDYPELDWTWDDFLARAVALTEGEDEEEKQYGFVGEVYELNDLIFMLERLGAKLVDTSVDPPALAFDDPATIEALRRYASLSTEHKVKPVFLTDITKLAGASSMYLQREALINDGRAAMWTSSGATAAILGRRSDLNVGAAPLPAEPGLAGAVYSTVSGYFISAQTESRQACWTWITFLSGQPGAVQGLPARRSVAESDEYRQQAGAEQADAYLASLGEGQIPSSFQALSEEDWLGGALFWLGEAYGQVVEGEAGVEETLDTAQEKADDYRACIVAAGDLSQDTWQACLKEIDPAIPDFVFSTGE